MPKTDGKTGRFVKANGGGPGRGKKSPAKSAGRDIARDMEIAYSTDETPGEPLGITEARRLAKSDYVKFLTLYARFKGEAGSGEVTQVAAAATPGPAAAGEKELKVGELIDRLLAEWNNE